MWSLQKKGPQNEKYHNKTIDIFILLYFQLKDLRPRGSERGADDYTSYETCNGLI